MDKQELRPWVVLYRPEGSRYAPLSFPCMAEDAGHAERLCAGEFPGCVVVWTYDGLYVDACYRDYLNNCGKMVITVEAVPAGPLKPFEKERLWMGAVDVVRNMAADGGLTCACPEVELADWDVSVAWEPLQS